MPRTKRLADHNGLTAADWPLIARMDDKRAIAGVSNWQSRPAAASLLSRAADRAPHSRGDHGLAFRRLAGFNRGHDPLDCNQPPTASRSPVQETAEHGNRGDNGVTLTKVRKAMPTELDPRHAVYVGSFDPITLGPEHIIRRGCRVFEHITVGIGINPDKPALFSPDERLQLARHVLSRYENVTVECFVGLSVDFVKGCGASVMLRGVRTLSDMEFEFSLSLTNRILASEVETVFLMASEAYSQISSTLIKQIAKMGQEATRDQLTSFVAPDVITPLLSKFDSLRT